MSLNGHMQNGEDRKALLVVVTFNSYSHLSDIVDAVKMFLDDDDANRVALIENSQDARIVNFITAQFKSDRLYAEVSPHNQGFSHAVNHAYRIAQDRWGDIEFVVLMNPDVSAGGNAACTLARRAKSHSEEQYGIWGPVLRDERGELDGGCARRGWNYRRFISHLVGFPGLLETIMRTPGRSLSYNEIQGDQNGLQMVSGAFMCIRSAVFQAGLDTTLPMYLEDQEICFRCVSLGYSVRVFSDLEAIHVGGVSRKSVKTREHALRVMEMVESAVQCMWRLEGHNVVGLRLTVLLAGLVRLLAAPVVAAFRTVQEGNGDEQIRWMHEQRKLGGWFMKWAIGGKLHRDEVSLSDYLAEYESRKQRLRQ